VQQRTRGILGDLVRQSPCTECGGSGRRIEEPCPTCQGDGRTIEERELQVEIPAGIHDGNRIRITGEGHAGTGGGHAGDAYLQVRVRPDERFIREGNDLFSQVDLTIVDAALGATVTVQTLDGPLELELDPGTQPGEVRVLRGKGMPVLQGFGRGDHRFLVNVTVPRRLTPEQRKLLEEFEQLSDDDTYRHDPGFFEKLKSAFR
jgi:molecular chaperone DnaJ